jgi:hypothetical protein
MHDGDYPAIQRAVKCPGAKIFHPGYFMFGDCSNGKTMVISRGIRYTAYQIPIGVVRKSSPIKASLYALGLEFGAFWSRNKSRLTTARGPATD